MHPDRRHVSPPGLGRRSFCLKCGAQAKKAAARRPMTASHAIAGNKYSAGQLRRTACGRMKLCRSSAQAPPRRTVHWSTTRPSCELEGAVLRWRAGGGQLAGAQVVAGRCSSRAADPVPAHERCASEARLPYLGAPDRLLDLGRRCYCGLHDRRLAARSQPWGHWRWSWGGPARLPDSISRPRARVIERTGRRLQPE